MIVNIRGTHGSGKTHLVRQFMATRQPEPLLGERSKIEAYHCAGDWYVIGSYANACGGCDTIKAKPEIGNTLDVVDMYVRRYAALGNVIFEGVIVTSVWGGVRVPSRWEALARDFPPVIFLFLDTPLEICFQRVLERSGGRKPKGWDEGKSSLHQKFFGCRTQFEKAQTKGVDARWLHYETALEELEEIVK